MSTSIQPPSAVRRPSARWRAPLVALLPAAVLLSGCNRPAGSPGGSPGGAPRAHDDLPSVVILSVDTLRSDRLPAYGYRGVETPGLDELRLHSVLFEQAFSPVPLTLPAHATLMTGLAPTRHGVRDNAGYRLGPDEVTLAEMLRERGYRTGGFVSAFVLRAETGIAQGFEEWNDEVGVVERATMSDLQRPGAQTLRAALAWLERVRNEPFFLFLHIYEPHTPYSPPEPQAARYGATYDGEVAAADAVVATLLETLRRLDLYDRAAVIVLADHGEGLLDHGEREHGVLLYREALQIPLLLKAPDSRGASSVATAVELADVAPTVLALAGVDPPPDLAGVSLLEPAAIAPDRPIYGETLYPELRLGWSRMLSLVEGRHHYLEAPDASPPAGELYDLLADPAETRGRAADDPALAARLGVQVRRLYAPATRPESLDDESRQALEALGYLTGEAAPAGNRRVDPRLHVGALERVLEGAGLLRRGERERAVAIFRAVLREHPGMLDAWQFLGLALAELRRPEEALEAFARALALSGNAAVLAPQSARLAFELGRFEDALAYERLADEAGAEDPTLRVLRTQSLLRLGRAEEALASARADLERWPDQVELLYQLGAVEMGAGALEEAEAHLRRVLDLRADYTPAMGDLAVLVASQGRYNEARELLERLLVLRPDDELARQNLRSIEERSAGR